MEDIRAPVQVVYVTDEPDDADFPAALDAADRFEVTAVATESVEQESVDAEAFDCGVVAGGRGVESLVAVRESWPNLPLVFVAPEGADLAEEALTRAATDYLEHRDGRDQRRLLATRIENAVARAGADRGSRSSRTERESRSVRSEGDGTSERSRVEEELRESETSLRKLYRTASNADLTFEQKRRRLLELGRNRLGVDVGFVSHVDGETFEIVDAVGSHELLQPGRDAPLSETYCRRTLDGDGLLSVRDAEYEGWVGDPAYETYGLGCYLGAKVVVDEELYGTICFADRNPRDRTFTDSEMVYVELISQWLGYELEQLADERRLRQQNERLEQFASVVSHDLRNPLNIAQIYLDLARESDSAEDFEQVEHAHDRMERLIEKLLALTQGDWTPSEVGDHDLSAVGEDAWRSVDTAGATYRFEDDVIVRADPEALQRLLENLFRNAVEHGSTSHQPTADNAVEHGGSDVTVRVGSLDDGEGFYVEDDGPGIPESERDRAFEYGYSTDDGGTGLGLGIVARIAEAHDWCVLIADAESGGARFEVRNATP